MKTNTKAPAEDALLQQIPSTILEDVDAEEDQQIMNRHREARDRVWVRGENFDDPPDYFAALRRHAHRMREQLRVARENGTYRERPVEERNAIILQGQARVARLAKARREWEQETGKADVSRIEERAAVPIVTGPSNEGHNQCAEEARPPETPASPKPEANPENESLSVQKAPTTQRDIEEMLREIRRGKTVAPPAGSIRDDPTAHASFHRRSSDDWMRNT